MLLRAASATGGETAREIRTYDLRVVTRERERESCIFERTCRPHADCADGKANDVARMKPLTAFHPCGFNELIVAEEKLLTPLFPFLLQNHEYGGYGDEPRRKR